MKALVSENVFEKTCVFAVGCFTATATGSGVVGSLLVPGAALGGVLGAIALQALFQAEPEHRKLVSRVKRRVVKSLTQSGEVDVKAMVQVSEALGAALDADDLFGVVALREALRGGSTIVSALTELTVESIGARDPRFSENGLARDFATTLFTLTFEAALVESSVFRQQATLAVAEATLSEVRGLSRASTSGAHNSSDEVVQDSLEIAWRNYHHHLARNFSAPVPGEIIPLSDLYVPLRAIALKKSQSTVVAEIPAATRRKLRHFLDEDQSRHHATGATTCDLSEELLHWLSSPISGKDAVRLVRGGPGSGKSTFAKYLCDAVANDLSEGSGLSEHFVLYVPLQRVDFSRFSWPKSIDEFFLQEGYFRCPPLEGSSDLPKHAEVLIVLDGLDEVSGPDAESMSASRNIVLSTIRWLGQKNQQQVKFRCLIIGRDASIEAAASNLVDRSSTLFLLPYMIDTAATGASGFRSEAGRDQRHIWWEKWSRLKPNVPTEFPAAYDNDALSEITGEPLLLFLLSRERFYEADQIADRKQVYDLLFERVVDDWHRDLDRWLSGRGPSAPAIIHLLENIGASAWANNTRVTSFKEVERFCQMDAALTRSFGELVVAPALNQAVMAFYFHVSSHKADVGLEFTHRSFGEYLAARFIIRTLIDLSEGEFCRSSVAAWVAIFRKGAISQDIATFLTCGLRAWPDDQRRRAGEFVAAMLRTFGSAEAGAFASEDGFPGAIQASLFLYGQLVSSRAEDVSPWRGIRDASQVISRALLRVHDREWHWRVPGWCYVPKIRDDCLDWFKSISFSGQNFQADYFASLDFRGSLFVDVNCSGSRFIDCRAAGADFRNADLRGTVWAGSNLTDANLAGADLRHADFRLANGLSVRQLSRARLDVTTLLPDYLCRAMGLG